MPVHRATIPEERRREVYDRVMAATGWGLLRPEERLHPSVVADRAGVPVDALATALPALQRDGVLELHEDLLQVTASTAAGLRELLQFRALVEVQLARRAADDGLTDDEETELRTLARDCRRAAMRGDELEYIRTDLRFHLRLCSLRGSPEVVELVRVLRVRGRIGRLPADEHHDFMTLNGQEHERLLEAVADGNSVEVERLLTRHITRIRDAWLDYGPVPAVDGFEAAPDAGR